MAYHLYERYKGMDKERERFLGLETYAVHALYHGLRHEGIDMDALSDADIRGMSDEDILSLDGVGVKALAILRRRFPHHV